MKTTMTSLTDTNHGDRDAGGVRPNPDAETRRDAGAGRWKRRPGTHGGAKAHEARETDAETAKTATTQSEDWWQPRGDDEGNAERGGRRGRG